MRNLAVLLFFILACGDGIAQQWTLQKCLDYALSHHKEIQVKESQITTTRFQQQSAVSKLLPVVSASVSTDYYWQIPVQVFPGQLLGQQEGTFVPVRLGTPWMGNAGATAEVKILDIATWRDIKLAALHRQQAVNDRVSMEKLLKKNVSMAYYNTLLGHTAVTEAGNRCQQHEQVHALVKKQFEKGVVDQIALNASESLLTDMREDSAGKAALWLKSTLDLKFWMGYPLRDEIIIGGDSLPQTEMISGETFNPTRLPEREQYQTAVRIAENQYDIEKAGFLPKLSLKSGYSRLGFGEHANFVTRSKWFSSGYVGLQATVPLFDLNKMSYRLREEKQLIRTAEIRSALYEEEQQQNYMKALYTLNDAATRLAMQENREKLVLETITLAARKIDKGIIDMIELRQVQDELSVLRQKRLVTQLDYFKAFVDLQYLQNY